MPATAGVLGRVQLREALLGHTKGLKSQINKNAADTAFAASMVAKAVGRNTIATTPSDLSKEPKDNRIWTGAMYEAFDAEVNQRGNKITVRYGWIRNKKNYFLIQEDGGQVGSKTVTGMHAMTNAQLAVERYLLSKGIK